MDEYTVIGPGGERLIIVEQDIDNPELVSLRVILVGIQSEQGESLNQQNGEKG